MRIGVIIVIIIGIIILIMVAAWAVGYFGSSASETIKPEGAVMGKALIVYDPGLSGGTKTAAGYMAEDLKAEGYEVKLAGVRSNEASDPSGYNILIVGSPTYGAKPTGPITSYLENLKSPGNITAGVYALAGRDAQDSNLVMAEMLQNKSIPVKVSVKYGNSAVGASADRSQYSDFISQLLA
ncbi:hypothetical protein [Methanobacterium sp.]|uniref:flavodoxin family protein n=1 Tax=Methanobacterium sp. TaxID=2164 RepID=UPI002ABC81D8|nr:hypothetical protein [Methanobacterium sp.]MDY9923680.1 hypothetical protein [Methanobacterium sp.]